MKLISKISIQINWLKEFYLFQKWGIPAVKRDKISKSVLQKYLPKNPIVIDCGAHDGSDTLELAKILKGNVFAFEPVDSIYSKLVGRVSGTKGIKTFKLALSNKNGRQKFFVSDGASDASSSLLEPKEHLKDHEDTFFSEVIDVDTKTLDSWANENGIEKVDMLWLDMQGFEMEMLKESRVILKTVSVIHTEVSVKETYKSVPDYREFRTFLEEKGFSVVFEAIPTGWDMGNVLFVRKSLL